MTNAFFSDLLTSIAERGRNLLDRGVWSLGEAPVAAADVLALCEALLSGRGEATGALIARDDARCLCATTGGGQRRILRGAGARFRPRPSPASTRRSQPIARNPDAAAASGPALSDRTAPAGIVPPAQSRARRDQGPRRHAGRLPQAQSRQSRSGARRRRFHAFVRRPGSIRAFLSCATSTGARRPMSSKRSSATKRFTRSAIGTTCAVASIRRTGAATPSSTRRSSMSR